MDTILNVTWIEKELDAMDIKDNYKIIFMDEARKAFEQFMKYYSGTRAVSENDTMLLRGVIFFALWKQLGFDEIFYSLSAHQMCKNMDSFANCDMDTFFQLLNKYYQLIIKNTDDYNAIFDIEDEDDDVDEFGDSKEEVEVVNEGKIDILERGTVEEANLTVQFIFGSIKSKTKPVIGQVCGQDFVTELGEGVYGKVYKTADNKAIKIVDREWNPKRGIKGQTLDEVIYQSHFKNPYITPILDVTWRCVDNPSKMAITMPIAEAGTLDDLLYKNDNWSFSLTNQPVDVVKGIKALRFKFAHDILCALNYMHKKNIMFLDLKLANILLFRFLKTIDPFGIRAEISDPGLAQNINGGHWKGPNEIVTASHRDPRLSCEIDEFTYGAPVDMWSFGILLQELFFGYIIPFESKYEIQNEPMVASEIILTRLQTTPKFRSELSSQKWSPDNAWCRALVDTSVSHNSPRKVKTFEEILPDREWFKTYYYTPEEYKNIWNVIDACMQYDADNRPSAEDLLSKFPLFQSKEFNDTCMYTPDESKYESKYEHEEFNSEFIQEYLGKNVIDYAKYLVSEIKANGMWDAELKSADRRDVKEVQMIHAALDLAAKMKNHYSEDLQLDAEEVALEDKIIADIVKTRNLRFL